MVPHVHRPLQPHGVQPDEVPEDMAALLFRRAGSNEQGR